MSGSKRRRQTHYRPRCEQLEDRRLLAGLPFVFTIDDPDGLFDPFPNFAASLTAAGEILTSMIDGLGAIEVRVIPDNSPSNPTATGGAESVTTINPSDNGFYVVENGTISEAKSGVDPNGAAPDILLRFNTVDSLPQDWFDPSGSARTAAIPANKQDFIGKALHELVHAMGFQGFRTTFGANTGAFTTEFPVGSGTFVATTYDRLTDFGTGALSDNLFFFGQQTVAVYGGPAPLTSLGPANATGGNFFHVGNPAGEIGDDLLPDLMNGVESLFGVKYDPSSLDLAILADLGLSVNDPNSSWHNATLPADVNNDGVVHISDLLVLISDLRANGVNHVLASPAAPPPFLDVNNDGSASVADLLAIISVLRAQEAASEAESSGGVLSFSVAELGVAAAGRPAGVTPRLAGALSALQPTPTTAAAVEKEKGHTGGNVRPTKGTFVSYSPLRAPATKTVDRLKPLFSNRESDGMLDDALFDLLAADIAALG